MSSMETFILGGLISLISVVVSIVLQHILSIRKMVHESKVYPSHVLYDKQIEFFDALAPLFGQINGYITAIDVWLTEKNNKAKNELKKAAQNNECLAELDQLLEKYNLYLPSEPLKKLTALESELWLLSINPNLDKASHTLNLLFETQNFIREFVGVNKLSQDLMKVIGSKPAKESKESE